MCKLLSKTITHKTDVGGVRLNLESSDAVRRAYRAIESSVREKAGAEHFQGVTVQQMIDAEGYELILGSSIDPQFGPVLLFGSGGTLVEVYQDRALALPPLTTTLARRMMEQTRIYKALQGTRGRESVNIAELEKLLVRFGQLVVEQRRIAEIDINPLRVAGDQIVALDARIGLHPADVPDAELPRPSIRPYPTQHARAWTSRDGLNVTIRPIRPEDEPALVRFHEHLSERTVYMRYFQMLQFSQRVLHDRLRRRCFIDYDREMALVVTRNGKQPEKQEENSGQEQILAVGRLSKLPGTDEAEFAVIVADPYQHHGIGSELLRRLVDIAQQEGVRRIVADILPENLEMQRVCSKIGFQIRPDDEEQVVQAVLDLGTQPASQYEKAESDV